MVATLQRIPGEASRRNRSLTVREAISQAFENLDGVAGLTEWAEKDENKKIFYTQIWPKILGVEAKDVSADHDPIEVIRQIIVDS